MKREAKTEDEKKKAADSNRAGHTEGEINELVNLVMQNFTHNADHNDTSFWANCIPKVC